jgi:hypothetical protein
LDEVGGKVQFIVPSSKIFIRKFISCEKIKQNLVLRLPLKLRNVKLYKESDQSSPTFPNHALQASSTYNFNSIVVQVEVGILLIFPATNESFEGSL